MKFQTMDYPNESQHMNLETTAIIFGCYLLGLGVYNGIVFNPMVILLFNMKWLTTVAKYAPMFFTGLGFYITNEKWLKRKAGNVLRFFKKKKK